MLELMIMLSRLIFVFLIAYFLLLGALYIAEEREVLSYDGVSATFHQRFAIIATTVLAFIILSFDPLEFTYNIPLAAIGAAFIAIYVYSLLIFRLCYKGSCPLIWNCMFFLLNVGVIMLARLDTELARKQLMWIFAGVSLTIFIPPAFRIFKKLDKLVYVYLALAWVFALLPFAFGKTIYGATNWASIFGITFQPSEIAKFFYIFYLSSVFSEKKSIKQMIFPSAMAGGIVLCLVAQRDFGTSLIYFMTYLVTVYVSTGSVAIFGAGITFASLAAIVSYKLMSHIQRRVAAWLDPFQDISDSGYQIAQSLFAIGTWGLLGVGLTRGLPYKIPVVYTDFIFSAVCEELGVLYGLCLIGVLMMLFFRGAVTALRSENGFFCILAVSVTGVLAFQSFLILGGVIKLIPLTGVTLPFVSYGGSSIVVSMILVGILAQLSKGITVDTAAEEGVGEVDGK